MISILSKAAALVGVLLGCVLVAVMFLDTEARPAPETIPGYTFSEISVDHRDTSIPFHVWYPTAAQNSEPELIGQNALFYGHYVGRDAAPAAGPLPVIVVSHGSGGNPRQLGWLMSRLANRGYIVISTNHPGTTTRDSDPHQTVNVWQRPQDMTALLDVLFETPPNGLVPDAARIGTVGFSLGGHSALSLGGLRVSKDLFIEYCKRNAGLIDCGWMQDAGVDFEAIDQERYEQSNKDNRVRAVVAIDPALPQAVPANGTADINAKSLVLNLGNKDEVPSAMRADGVASQIARSAYQAIPGAWHFTFLAECSALGRIVIGTAGEDNICSDQGYRDRAEVHDKLGEVIGIFLDQALSLEAK